MRLDSDLVDAFEASIDGRVSEGVFRWSTDAAATVILASEGYPGPYVSGKKILGLSEAELSPAVKVFHAGTSHSEGAFTTAGGRVLAVSARAPSLEAALREAYAAVSKISFEGMQYRRDIGARAARQKA
jgi:phosphoribosylamine--glycine ligase